MARKPALAADVQADVIDTPSKSRSYGVNHFRILGRMTADPQMRFTQNGKAVLTPVTRCAPAWPPRPPPAAPRSERSWPRPGTAR